LVPVAVDVLACGTIRQMPAVPAAFSHPTFAKLEKCWSTASPAS
jgi:hypothetical protein